MQQSMRIVLAVLLIVCLATACKESRTEEYTSEVRKIGPTVESQVMQHPDWSHSAVGYKINLYDQSLAGNIQGATADLPRLKELGVDFVILPPVFPGTVTQDSIVFHYKAYTDFETIDEEYGTLDEFNNFVNECHSRGLRVLLTWPSGQVSENHQWKKDYPTLFIDSAYTGLTRPYWKGVSPMKYDNDTTLQLFTQTFSKWKDDHKVDGFYCAESELITLEFWEKLRSGLQGEELGFFMASDYNSADFHRSAFDMTSAIDLRESMLQISEGMFPPEAIDLWMQQTDRDYPLNSLRELFLTDAKHTSASGTLQEQYGEMHKLFAVLQFTLSGTPVMYCGQEVDAGIKNQLFAKDSIDFENALYTDFYKRLIEVRHNNEALWGGLQGGNYERLNTVDDEALFAFSRTAGENKVIVVLNFSDKPTEVQFRKRVNGTFDSIFNNQLLSIFTEGDVKLRPYEYQVFVR